METKSNERMKVLCLVLMLLIMLLTGTLLQNRTPQRTPEVPMMVLENPPMPPVKIKPVDDDEVDLPPFEIPAMVVDPLFYANDTTTSVTAMYEFGADLLKPVLPAWDILVNAFSGEPMKERSDLNKRTKLLNGQEEMSTCCRDFYFDYRILRLVIASNRYFAYRDKPHKPDSSSTKDYAAYATPDDELIKILSAHLCQGVPKDQQVQRIVSFVQECIPYSIVVNTKREMYIDNETQREFVRYPIETLYEGWGDCEDLSLLAASLIAAAGHDVLMVTVPPSKPTKEELEEEARTGKKTLRMGHALIAVRGAKGRLLTFEGNTYTVVELTRPVPVGKKPRGNWKGQDFTRADMYRIAPAPPAKK